MANDEREVFPWTVDETWNAIRAGYRIAAERKLADDPTKEAIVSYAREAKGWTEKHWGPLKPGTRRDYTDADVEALARRLTEDGVARPPEGYFEAEAAIDAMNIAQAAPTGAAKETPKPVIETTEDKVDDIRDRAGDSVDRLVAESDSVESDLQAIIDDYEGDDDDAVVKAVEEVSDLLDEIERIGAQATAASHQADGIGVDPNGDPEDESDRENGQPTGDEEP